jgi:hypothetical protein
VQSGDGAVRLEPRPASSFAELRNDQLSISTIVPWDPNPPEALTAFSEVLDEIAIAGRVERTLWFGIPAARVEGRIFLALWRGALVARLGAEDVDECVLAGQGTRFDPLNNGPFADWLESNADYHEWADLALSALVFTAGGER